MIYPTHSSLIRIRRARRTSSYPRLLLVLAAIHAIFHRVRNRCVQDRSPIHTFLLFRFVGREPDCSECVLGLLACRQILGFQEADLFALSANYHRRIPVSSLSSPPRRHGKRPTLEESRCQTYHTQQPPNSITRLRAHAQPIPRPGDINLDVLHLSVSFLRANRCLGDWIVRPEDLQGFGIAGCAGVREHDVVEGFVTLGTGRRGDAGEAKPKDHCMWMGWRDVVVREVGKDPGGHAVL